MNTEEIFNLYNQLGSYSAVSKTLGIDSRTVKRHVQKWHEENSFASSEASRTGIPFGKISHYWLKTKNEEGDDVSLFVKNQHEVMEYEEIRDALIKDLEQFAPVVKKIDYDVLPQNNQHLVFIDPADLHLGKLAVTEETGHREYNIQTAFERAYIGVVDLLSKAKAFGIHQIVIVVGNDILHTDNGRRTTTAGTPQDTDGQWWETFETARRLYVSIIELAKTFAPVTIVYCPSNHDKVLGFGLADSLFSWYRKDANVSFSNYGKSLRSRKYIRYGSNLIGFTHGDGAKNKDLTSLMQYEAREDWAQCSFSYWYIHHWHHKFRIINNTEIEKDHNGVTVVYNYGSIDPSHNTSIECVRSPSEPDAWHSHNGYVNTCAVEAFIHHPTKGQVARLTSYC